MAPDEPDQTTPSVEPTPEPTPSPAVEAAPEQEPVVSAEPVEAPAEPVAEPAMGLGKPHEHPWRTQHSPGGTVHREPLGDQGETLLCAGQSGE